MQRESPWEIEGRLVLSNLVQAGGLATPFSKLKFLKGEKKSTAVDNTGLSQVSELAVVTVTFCESRFQRT